MGGEGGDGFLFINEMNIKERTNQKGKGLAFGLAMITLEQVLKKKVYDIHKQREG